MEWRAQITKGLTETKPTPWEFKILLDKRRQDFLGREATEEDTKIVAADPDRLSIEANKANWAPQAPEMAVLQ
jgi:hypothetical protein